MGRLFWKCFLATWVTLILAAVVTFSGVELYRKSGPGAHLVGGPKADFELSMAEHVLRHGGEAALIALLTETRNSMIVLDSHGRDIRGRSLTPEQTALVARLAQSAAVPREIHQIAIGNDRYTLFLPDAPAPDQAGPGQPGPGQPGPELPGLTPPPTFRPSLWPPLFFAFLASVSLSAMLAWYLASPIKHLRGAFKAMASGQLETRVGALMRRRDEISDLGREFDRMAGQIQSLILAQRRLLHDVSHELRSPLNRLQVAMGIVRQEPAALAPTLDRMEREVTRLDELIGEILTLARLNSGVEDEKPVPVDLGELVEDIVEDARFEAESLGCAVRLHEHGHVQTMGRPRLLARAVENVVRNGLRYSPQGGVLEVEVTERNGQAVIKVRDQGPGIPEEDLQTVFEPFKRGARGTNNGFGLGLAIAKGAVDMHGGAIIAANRPEGGLSVAIRLPNRPA